MPADLMGVVRQQFHSKYGGPDMPGELDFSVQVTIPTFNARAFEKIVYNGLKKGAIPIKKDFEATVATWRHRPQFVIEDRGLWIGTYNKLYGWLDAGAKRYVRVQPGFRAKTQRRWIGSGGGGGDIIRNADGSPRFFDPYQAPGRQWAFEIMMKHVFKGTQAIEIVKALAKDINSVFRQGRSMATLKGLARGRGPISFQDLL